MGNFTSKFVKSFVCLTAFSVRYVLFARKHNTIRVMLVWKCMPLVLSFADLENINSTSELLSIVQDWSVCIYRCYN